MLRPPTDCAFAALFSEGVEADPPLSLAQKRQQRETLFAETARQRLAREAADFLEVLASPLAFPAIVACLRHGETAVPASPNPRLVRAAPDGLAGPADLYPQAVIDGYAQGLFMRALLGRPAWWSPSVRCARLLDSGTRAAPVSGARFYFDEAFDRTMLASTRAAVRRREAGALTPAMLDVFARMHDRGDAHSFALRDETGTTLAGGWGVSSGRAFFTEGLFETRAGAAAEALKALEFDLARAEFMMHATRPELARAADVTFPRLTRDAFLALNARAGASVRRGSWRAVETPEPSISAAA